MNFLQILQLWDFYHIEGIVYIITTIFSSVLCFLTVFAYRKSKSHRLKYAILSFGVLSLYTFYEGVENFLDLENSTYNMVPPFLILFVSILFFISILIKNRKKIYL